MREARYLRLISWISQRGSKQEVPIVFFILLCPPQRTAYREVLSQMAAHLRIGNPLKAGGIAGSELRTAESQSGDTTNEPPLLLDICTGQKIVTT